MFESVLRHLDYFHSLDGAYSQREFASRLVCELTQFLDACASADSQLELERHVTCGAGAKESEMTMQSAADRFPLGMKHLKINLPLSEASLIDAYRRAARAVHPDLGGDHDTMVEVNAAVAWLRESLTKARYETSSFRVFLPSANSQSWPAGGARSVDELRARCTIQLLDSAIDLWDIDLANLVASTALQQRWFLAQLEGDRIGMAERVTRSLMALVVRLAKCGRVVDGRHIYDRCLVAFEASNHITRTAIVSATEALMAPDTVRIAPLMHPMQVTNAYACGAISAVSFRKQARRLQEQRVSAENRDRETLESMHKFIAYAGLLPSDGPRELSASHDDLIPFPKCGFSGTGPLELSPMQRAEYHAEFGGQPTLSGWRKYGAVRWTSSLATLATTRDKELVNKLKAEWRGITQVEQLSFRFHFSADGIKTMWLFAKVAEEDFDSDHEERLHILVTFQGEINRLRGNPTAASSNWFNHEWDPMICYIGTLPLERLRRAAAEREDPFELGQFARAYVGRR